MKSKILKFLTLAAALCGATAWGAGTKKLGNVELSYDDNGFYDANTEHVAYTYYTDAEHLCFNQDGSGTKIPWVKTVTFKGISFAELSDSSPDMAALKTVLMNARRTDFGEQFKDSMEIAFENCTFNQKTTHLQVYKICPCNVTKYTFTGCTFNQDATGQYAVTLNCSETLYDFGPISYSITGCTVNSKGRGINVTAGTETNAIGESLPTVVIDNNTFNLPKSSNANMAVQIAGDWNKANGAKAIEIKNNAVESAYCLVRVNSSTSDNDATKFKTVVDISGNTLKDCANIACADGDNSTVQAIASNINAMLAPAPAVAKIGDQEFETLAEAFAAVADQSGDNVTIEILCNVSETVATLYTFTKNVTITADSAVTLDFQATAATGGLCAHDNTTLTVDSKVTIKNVGNFGVYRAKNATAVINGFVTAIYFRAMGDKNGEGTGKLIVNGTIGKTDNFSDSCCYLRFENKGVAIFNGNLNAGEAVEATPMNTQMWISGTVNSSELTLNNVAIKMLANGDNGKNTSYIDTTLNNSKLQFGEADFSSFTVNGSISLDANSVLDVGRGFSDLTISEGSVMDIVAGAKVSANNIVNNGTINVTVPADAVTDENGTLLIDYTGTGTPNYGTVVINDNPQLTSEVKNNDLYMTKPPAVAKIGDQEYATLEGAVAAAKIGDMIKLTATDAASAAALALPDGWKLLNLYNDKTFLYARLIPTSPRVITTADELVAFAAAVNAGYNYAGETVQLGNSLDLTGVDFVPIGANGKTFSGTFDGNRKTISNLKVSANANYAGLFGSVFGANIKDINLVNAVVSTTGENYAGALVGGGYAHIENCTVTGGSVTGVDQVGGVIGYLSCGHVKGCTVDGVTVTANGDRAGGITGKANVDSEYEISGNTVKNATIAATKKIGEMRSAAGLVGQVMAGAANHWVIADNTILSTMTKTADDTTFVPVGEFRSGNFEADAVTGEHIVRNYWESDPASTYYDMVNPANAEQKVTINNYLPVAEIDGTKYYSLAEAFAAAKSGDTIRLMSDVDLAGVNWKPVTFNGTFDGQNHTIRNLRVSDTTGSYQAFIGYSTGCTIKDVTFVDSYVDGVRSAVVLGCGYSATLNNVKVQGATVLGDQKCGGLIGMTGENAPLTVTNCEVKDVLIKSAAAAHSDVQGASFGGLIGFVHKGNTATITGNKVSGITFEGLLPASYYADKAELYYQYLSHAFIGAIIGRGTEEQAVTLANNTVEQTEGLLSCATTTDYCGFYYREDWSTLPVTTITIDGVPVKNRCDAKIGEKKYFTLAEAVAAVQNGETITLLADATLNATVTVNKNLKLDLNGKNIETGSNYFLLTQGAFEVTGEGVVEGNAAYIFKVVGTTEDVANYSVLTIGEDVTVKNENDQYYTCMVSPYVSAKPVCYYGAVINFNGTSESAAGLYVNGQLNKTSGNVPQINIGSTAKITASNGYALYAAGYARYNVDGELTGVGGIEAKGGVVTVGEHAKITATATSQSHEANGNGASTSGYAIASVTNPGYAGTVVKVEGGQVTGKVDVINDTTSEENAAKIEVSGGSFSEPVLEQYCATGYIPTAADANGLYTVKAGVYVAQVGDAKFETLEAAIAAAQTGDTVELLADVALTKALTVGSSAAKHARKFTIDLGGHKITGKSQTTVFYIYDDVTLKNGEVDYYGMGVMSYAVNAYGNVAIEGVSITDKKNNAGYMLKANAGATLTLTSGVITSSKPRGAIVDVANGGTFVMEGGKLVNNYNFAGAAGACVNAASGSSVEIKDGELDAALVAVWVNSTDVEISGGKVVSPYNVWVNNGKVDISGGTFEAAPTAVYLYKDGATANISGGTFTATGTDKNFLLNKLDAVRDTTEFNVTGGTFYDFDPMNNAAEGANTDFVDPALASTAGTQAGSFIIVEAVARVNEGLRYPTLAEAVEAAEAGDTVLVLKDNTEAITIPVGVTIDLNGKTTGALSAPAGYEVVDGAAAGTKTVARKAIVINMDDQTPTLIKVDEDWITANVSENALTDVVKAKLESVAANGLKVWQNYVMGVDGSNAANTLTTDYAVGAGEMITVKTPIAAFNPPADSGITVTYRLLRTTTPEDATSWSTFAEGAARPEFPVDLAGQTGDTYWKIEAVFTGAKAQ